MRHDFRNWEELVQLADDIEEGDSVVIHVGGRQIVAEVEINDPDTNGHTLSEV